MSNLSKLDKRTAVFGGYGADALLKAAYIRKPKHWSKFSFLPDINLKSETRTQVEFTEVVSSKALKEVYSRRKQYIDTVKEVRLHSSHEWFALWPYTMRETSPNITVNRRLFPSYEVYLSNKVVKVSSVVPVCWKTNRKLFNRATKKYLSKSKYIKHADGRLPYYPWHLNLFIQLPTWSEKVIRKLFRQNHNNGPWANWLKLSHSISLQVELLDLGFLPNNLIDIEQMSLEQKNNLLSLCFACVATKKN